ncbi:hypothetical protein N7456_011421 [Penicillium angulare]|uniref:NAD(+) ADP-ribosyltransferase n=1 Tax=Penicillium angulare TaxID=116970 RepID=A0A9W9ETZ8_9EURO|nr:hypothetical protein N7456_011421 [Penicillium angulare]
MDSSPLDMVMRDKVISVHGKFDSHTHREIEQKVKEAGAQFENCKGAQLERSTHLLTTERELHKKITPKKIKRAIEKGCKIVSIDWFLQSMQEGQLAPEDEFTLDSVRTIQSMRQNDGQIDQEVEKVESDTQGSAHRPSENGLLLKAILDITIPTGGMRCSVWKENGVTWDAILIKPESSNNIITHHLQIVRIWNLDKYYLWSCRRTNHITTTIERMGQGKLSHAKSAFKKKFRQATGLSWERRHEEPGFESGQSNFIFLPRQYNRMANLSTLELTEELLPQGGIKAVLELIDTRVERLNPIKVHCKLESRQMKFPDYLNIMMTYPADTNEDRLKVALTLLRRLMKQPGLIEKVTSQKDVFLTLIQCYRVLLSMHGKGFTVKQLQHEIDQLLCPKKASTSAHHHSLRSQGSTAISKRLKLTSYQRDEPVELRGIFRIDRGEAERYDKWRASNGSLERRLLWHGSPRQNFAGILTHGFRGGLEHDPRIYLAELAGVSQEYCLKDDGLQDDFEFFKGNLMLLCEVSDSFIGRGQAQWRDASDIHADLAGVKMLDIAMGERLPAEVCGTGNNQYVYEHSFPHQDQIRMRYLFHFQ